MQEEFFPAMKKKLRNKQINKQTNSVIFKRPYLHWPNNTLFWLEYWHIGKTIFIYNVAYSMHKGT